MSDRSKWHVPARVEVNGQPFGCVRAALFMAAFLGLCGGIVLWRATLGRAF